MENKKRFILLWLILAILLFFLVMNIDNSKNSTDYNPLCFDCQYYDYTDFVKSKNPVLINLNNERISNIVISYNRFMSKKGKISLSFNYYNKSKNRIERIHGTAYDINTKDISWSMFSDVSISFIDGRLIVYADERFKDNNMFVLWQAVNVAFIDGIKKIKD